LAYEPPLGSARPQTADDWSPSYQQALRLRQVIAGLIQPKPLKDYKVARNIVLRQGCTCEQLNRGGVWVSPACQVHGHGKLVGTGHEPLTVERQKELVEARSRIQQADERAREKARTIAQEVEEKQARVREVERALGLGTGAEDQKPTTMAQDETSPSNGPRR